MIPIFLGCVILLIFGERIIKHWLVIRFFCAPIPVEKTPIQQVSILQPILSGDPTMPERLEQNLLMHTRYTVDFVWLVDEDDPIAQATCQTLIEQHPENQVQLIILPPPENRQNPKMVKLIEGFKVAQGEVICVLDDDTSLPDAGLEQCLPYLDQPGVGLAFGLPYYISFHNLWSRLVAYFVNSHSLLTYIPYAFFFDPVTINGMFYAIRRSVLNSVGGFEGLENILADDFAIAQRMRQHGYRLAQTPLRHGISTWVSKPGDYFNLLQRWFIFPRESVMRHLKGRELFALYVSVMMPVFFPWLALLLLVIAPSYWPVTLAYLVYSYLVFAHINRAYLADASPWLHSYWVTLISLFMPLQILVAFSSPQHIIWRGHSIHAEPGGELTFVRRPPADPPDLHGEYLACWEQILAGIAPPD